MRKLSPVLLAFLLAFTVGLHAKDQQKAARYLDPSTINVEEIIGNPPAVGSPEVMQEIALMLQKQEARTPEDVARIKTEATLNVFLFADVLGPWFNKENLPVTRNFIAQVAKNDDIFVSSGKKFWNRPRPPVEDPRLHPAIDLPSNASYPSGHAAISLVYALVLAQLAPDLKDQLVARAHLVGDDRVLAGVHFPSDVAAGQKLTQAIFDRMSANPLFQADLAAAKKEFDSVRPKP